MNKIQWNLKLECYVTVSTRAETYTGRADYTIARALSNEREVVSVRLPPYRQTATPSRPPPEWRTRGILRLPTSVGRLQTSRLRRCSSDMSD